jgi:hypothetical protein
MQLPPKPLRPPKQRLPIPLAPRRQPLQLLSRCGHQLTRPDVFGVALAGVRVCVVAIQ